MINGENYHYMFLHYVLASSEDLIMTGTTHTTLVFGTEQYSVSLTM